MSSIDEQMAFHAKEMKRLYAQKQRVQANRFFVCACGNKHRIKDCKAIQTHWYVSPHGCTGGDYWNEGELHILCPDNQVRQRAYFQINFSAPWDKRADIEYNAEMQFKQIYSKLFSSVNQEYVKDAWGVINSYFDKNHKKFDIKVKKD